MNFSDETVMAYADGELDAASRAALEAAMATDPQLARRVARQRALRARLRAALDPVLDEPLPERLLASVRGAAWRFSATTLAACPRDGQVLASGALARALSEQLASQQPPGAPVQIGVSFRARNGDYCRTFVLRGQGTLAGLACRGHEAWRLEVLAQTAGQPAAAAGYRPAGSALPASVARTLDELIAGEPLDAGAEAAARARGWQP